MAARPFRCPHDGAHANGRLHHRRDDRGAVLVDRDVEGHARGTPSQLPRESADLFAMSCAGRWRTTMMLHTKPVVFALLAFCAGACVTQSSAAYAEALTVAVENDVFTGADNNYSNGIGVTWGWDALDSYDDDKFVSKWGRFWRFLPFVGDEGYTTYASWSVAQEMHT